MPATMLNIVLQKIDFVLGEWLITAAIFSLRIVIQPGDPLAVGVVGPRWWFQCLK